MACDEGGGVEEVDVVVGLLTKQLEVVELLLSGDGVREGEGALYSCVPSSWRF